MSHLKHTEGEWVDGNTSDSVIVKGLNIESDSDKFYGGFVICESVSKNNKALIKASPRLLKALIRFIKEPEFVCGWDKPCPCPRCQAIDVIEEVTELSIKEVIK